MKKEIKNLLKYLKKTNNLNFKKINKLAILYSSTEKIEGIDPEDRKYSMEIDLYDLASLVFEDKFEFPVFESQLVAVEKPQEDE